MQVADSKRVHQGPHGKRRLEMAVLSFWGAWRGRLPADLHTLLTETGNDPDVLRSCPWYEDLSLALPLFNDRCEVELRAHLLQRELTRRSIEVLHIGARLVEVEEFNRLIADTDNKSHTHFHAYSAVIADLIRRIPAGSHLVADRCGGRVHYRGSLRRIYPAAEVRTLRESDDMSEYEVRRAQGSVRITFATQGEDRSFSTALASCMAKYVRELAVHVLNQWFAARVPDLKPTAGYFLDGRRFLADIDDLVRSRALPVERLVRVR